MFEPVKYKVSAPDASEEATDSARDKQQREYQLATLDSLVLAEIYEQLAKNPPPWYTAEMQLADWPISERFAELEERPDLRLGYMLKGVTEGLPKISTRKKKPATQAEWLDEVRESGEKSALDQIRMFDYHAQMPHTDRAKRVQKLWGRIDWNDDSPASKEFYVALIKSGLQKDRKFTQEGKERTHSPAMTCHQILTDISPMAFVHHISEEKRAASMTKRLAYEAKGKFLPAEEELLEIVTIESFCLQMPSVEEKPIVALLFFKNLKYPEVEKVAPQEPAPAHEENEGPKAL